MSTTIITDHRQSNRRGSRRVEKPIPMLVFWMGKSGRHPADICDVSESGCYLNTGGAAELGDRITVEIPASIAPEQIVCITGTVVPQVRKHVGFGMHFDPLNVEQAALVARLLEQSPQLQDRRDRSKP